MPHCKSKSDPVVFVDPVFLKSQVGMKQLNA